jgi:hypothetical protein
LRKEVQRRLPRAELPEILLEIAARTEFSNEFTHISERDSRASELVTSICAVLVAQACNTGTGPLERNDVPALRRSRLSWVNQNYIRNETLTAANACLVAAQNRIPLVRHWGGGEVASADGLRFVVPVRTVHAGPNPKYFGMGHGVTYYNLVSNQFTGLNGIVVPGTLRLSGHHPQILELLGSSARKWCVPYPLRNSLLDRGERRLYPGRTHWGMGFRTRIAACKASAGDDRFPRVGKNGT